MDAVSKDDADPAANPEPLDVFLLYNEKEKRSAWLARELRKAGLRVHFSRSDLAVGDRFEEIERDRLRRAAAVVVLLGKEGWGPGQLSLLDEARTLSKPLWPVLIGTPDPEQLEHGGDLFLYNLYTDLSGEDDATALARLARLVQSALASAAVSGPTPRFDELIGILVDGSDAQRSALLERLVAQGFADSPRLAERLRKRLRTDFAPGQEMSPASAVRTPKRLSSIRSWMLSTLIWLDPDHPDTREVTLTHLNPGFEPDRDVRFWCLASLIQRRTAYLDEATARAREDREPVVSDLAVAASSPHDGGLAERFESDLWSEDFEQAWHVLRILRVLPLPQLASAVCRQLGRLAGRKPLTYDALFALANPEMAAAAHDTLMETPGLEDLASMILEESRESNEIAVRRFAALLSIFDPAQARAALEAAAGDEESRQTARRIAGFMAEYRVQEDRRELFIAGYSSDTIDVGHDDLGITRDVETLAAVMLAREVTPPLAIGLFGPWGSGKSFFMKSIQAAIGRLVDRARRANDPRFCDRVVAIEFNAWHYNDANLWASLVSHILDKLSAFVTPGTTAAQKEEALQKALTDAQSEVASAEADRAEAQAATAEAQGKLDKLRTERESEELGWRDLSAVDFLALLDENKNVETELKAALKSVGAPAAVASVEELDRVVRDSYSTAGRAMTLLVGLARAPNRGLLVGGILLVIVAPILVGWLVSRFVAADLGRLSAALTGIAVVAGTAGKLLGAAVRHMGAALDRVSEARTKVQKLLDAKRAPPSAEEDQLARTVTESRAREEEAAARAAAAAARAADLEHQVAVLRESQSLGYFLSERNRSDDYRRHLGLISIIRKDFEELVDRLRAPGPGAGVERIVLYIDDLDRCPANMVVDVLQAVHLLLAYPLFVVVVSVDPRWLLRSLEARYPHFELGNAAADEAWLTTPQDYLEKIFQIPFSVRPMGSGGFARLMGRVLAASAADSERNASQRSPAAGGGGEAPDDRGPATADGSGDAIEKEEEKAGAEPAVPRFEIVDEALVIRAWELQFASRLHEFIPTPRAAKRFANIYRILKAPLDRAQLRLHEGTQELPGDFRLPMLLLALLIGRPGEAAQLLPEFLANAEAGHEPFWARAEGARATSRETEEVRAEFAALAGDPGFPQTGELVKEWLPRVARFSFVTAGIRRPAERAAAGDGSDRGVGPSPAGAAPTKEG